MKCHFATAVAVALGFSLPACGRSGSDKTPPAQASASPTPKDELDKGANRLKTKAQGAFAAVENYLLRQNPKLREKFDRDRAKWRDKLQQQQKDLQPQIDHLKDQLEHVDSTATREQLHGDLARLEAESKRTEQRLTELEAASQEAWKSFKQRLREDQSSHVTPSPTP